VLLRKGPGSLRRALAERPEDLAPPPGEHLADHERRRAVVEGLDEPPRTTRLLEPEVSIGIPREAKPRPLAHQRSISRVKISKASGGGTATKVVTRTRSAGFIGRPCDRSEWIRGAAPGSPRRP
jgi:hypothetical protein